MDRKIKELDKEIEESEMKLKDLQDKAMSLLSRYGSGSLIRKMRKPHPPSCEG